MAKSRSPRARRLLWRRERRAVLDARAAVAPDERDGRLWTLGRPEDVEWIDRDLTDDPTITSAIPPVFAAYATVAAMSGLGREGRGAEGPFVEILRRYGSAEWWLGYLDDGGGGGDVIFPRADRVYLYAGWPYVFVKAGPDQALSWREDLPEVMFPVDRSWLMTRLWDDTWTCLGGAEAFVTALRGVAALDWRPISPGDYVVPPGHHYII